MADDQVDGPSAATAEAAEQLGDQPRSERRVASLAAPKGKGVRVDELMPDVG